MPKSKAKDPYVLLEFTLNGQYRGACWRQSEIPGLLKQLRDHQASGITIDHVAIDEIPISLAVSG